MEHREETFQWYPDTYLIFPIDYTSRESAMKFGQKSRAFREHVLRNEIFRDVLLEFLLPLDKKSQKNGDEEDPNKIMPPIPLEAMPLLNCFYQLTKETDCKYHRDFFHSTPKSSDNIDQFWTDLCMKLYEWTAPPQDDSEPDTYAFCRHVLFQNEQFTSAVIAPLWRQEILPRFEKIQVLAGQVNLQNQIEAFRNCLISLDNTILSLHLQLQRQENSEPQLESAPVTTNSIRELLKGLLSIRNNYKVSKDRSIVYNLPSLKLDDGSTLREAFKDKARRGKRHPKMRLSYQWQDKPICYT